MNVEKKIIPTGTYMLMWFVNPDNIKNSEGKIENSISTQFFKCLEDAEEMANLLSGNKIIFKGFQNTEPEYNIYWYIVKKYGKSFDLSNLTTISQ